MRYKVFGVVRTNLGVVVPNASITVSLSGGGTLATIYGATTGGSPIAGSAVISDANGYFEFWVDNVNYAKSQKFRLSITGSGITSIYDDISGEYETAEGGPTASRPAVLGANDVGFTYYDATLARPVWWTGTGWADPIGSLSFSVPSGLYVQWNQLGNGLTPYTSPGPLTIKLADNTLTLDINGLRVTNPGSGGGGGSYSAGNGVNIVNNAISVKVADPTLIIDNYGLRLTPFPAGITSSLYGLASWVSFPANVSVTNISTPNRALTQPDLPLTGENIYIQFGTFLVYNGGMTEDTEYVVTWPFAFPSYCVYASAAFNNYDDLTGNPQGDIYAKMLMEVVNFQTTTGVFAGVYAGKDGAIPPMNGFSWLAIGY